METLYRRVLGEPFAHLHPVLHRFHSSPDGGTAAGLFRVTHHPGRLRKVLAAVLRLPPAQDAVELCLEVTPTGPGERWSRSFGNVTLVTWQTSQGGLLVERSGPVSFGLAVEVVAGGLTFQTRRVWLLGVPLPAWCAPAVDATVVPNNTGWAVAVRLCLPWLGPLLDYEGEVVPVWK